MVNSIPSDEVEVDNFPTLSYKQSHDEPIKFKEELKIALLTTGFFYLSEIDSIIPTFNESYSNLFRDSEAFFDLSDVEKEEILMIKSRHFRGYSKVGNELTNGKRDMREQIDFGPDTKSLVPYPITPHSIHPIQLSLYGPNQYPIQISTFKESLTIYRNHCDTISHHLISLLAQTLTESNSELITKLFFAPTSSTTSSEDSPAYSRMKIVRYPPVSNELAASHLGVGSHKDGGGLTLLAQDDIGGLEVQIWTGEWKSVKPKLNTLVINVGQVIENLSHGLYSATTHRVKSTISNKSRFSIPYFFSPHLLNEIKPLPIECLNFQMKELLESNEEKIKRNGKITEVKLKDLHADVFGISAWRGITRSHGEVWEKFYGKEVDKIGGPDLGAEERLVVV